LAFTWLPPSFTGGTNIIDYTINIASLENSFTVLATGVTTTSYIATALTAGITY